METSPPGQKTHRSVLVQRRALYLRAGLPFENLGDADKHVVEKHFNPAELAEIWGLDDDTVRSLFDGEPGVMVINRPGTRHKRRYRTFRIPESVAVRVHNRLTSRS